MTICGESGEVAGGGILHFIRVARFKTRRVEKEVADMEWTPQKFLFVVLFFVLLFYGPKNLPALGRILGSWFRDLRNMKDDDHDEKPGGPTKKDKE
jgi:hypothetical protein